MGRLKVEKLPGKCLGYDQTGPAAPFHQTPIPRSQATHVGRLLGLPGLLGPTPPPRNALAPDAYLLWAPRRAPLRAYNVPAPHAVRHISHHVTQCPIHVIPCELKSGQAKHRNNYFHRKRPHVICRLKFSDCASRSFAFLQQLRLYRAKTTDEPVYTRGTTMRSNNTKH